MLNAMELKNEQWLPACHHRMEVAGQWVLGISEPTRAAERECMGGISPEPGIIGGPGF